ncbi:hypothetical protein HKX48_007169 [Thoreauomyces humboldtii]|nr:hypothetical protein HKX48_007169 [Thoreauomyces humboldtii]
MISAPALVLLLAAASATAAPVDEARRKHPHVTSAKLTLSGNGIQNIGKCTAATFQGAPFSAFCPENGAMCTGAPKPWDCGSFFDNNGNKNHVTCSYQYQGTYNDGRHLDHIAPPLAASINAAMQRVNTRYGIREQGNPNCPHPCGVTDWHDDFYNTMPGGVAMNIRWSDSNPSNADVGITLNLQCMVVESGLCGSTERATVANVASAAKLIPEVGTYLSIAGNIVNSIICAA